MSLLIKLGIFEEPLARFYIAEVTCAVDSVHKMGFIHRCVVGQSRAKTKSNRTVLCIQQSYAFPSFFNRLSFAGT